MRTSRLGGRTTCWPGCLLARRLAESGIKFTPVYFSRSIGGRRINDGDWDTHGFDNTRMYPIVEGYQLPITDQIFPTLLEDLEQRACWTKPSWPRWGNSDAHPKSTTVSRDHFSPPDRQNPPSLFCLRLLHFSRRKIDHYRTGLLLLIMLDHDDSLAVWTGTGKV